MLDDSELLNAGINLPCECFGGFQDCIRQGKFLQAVEHTDRQHVGRNQIMHLARVVARPETGPCHSRITYRRAPPSVAQCFRFQRRVAFEPIRGAFRMLLLCAPNLQYGLHRIDYGFGQYCAVFRLTEISF